MKQPPNLLHCTGWSSQNCCQATLLVSVKLWWCINHLITKYAFPDWCRNKFGSSKTYLSLFISIYCDWTLAESAKNAAQSHCCWVPKMKMLQPPKHSCKYAFPDWCRNEFGLNKTYLSLFNYYDWTLAEAAKTAAQPLCCWVPKWRYSNHLKTHKKAFPDRSRNEFGSNKTYLSLFNSFYYGWTLADAAKTAAQPHCSWVPTMKMLQPPKHSCK